MFLGQKIKSAIKKILGLDKGRSFDPSISLRYAKELVRRLPELKEYCSNLEDLSPNECNAFIDFCHSQIPLIYAPAKETYLRSLLHSLKKKTSKESQKLIDQKIAESNLRDGIVERALKLKDEQVKKEIEIFDSHYRSKIGYLKTDWFWKDFPDIRGQSLKIFFERQKNKLRGKKILHFSPEQILKKFFLAEKKNLKIDYKTSDIFYGKEDLTLDITRIKAENNSFDLIICHRVLEHVLDDQSALKEMYRVLKVGGELNISVPQSMNRSGTVEWIIPDKSHSNHIRQYGRDFENRLKEAGFAVKIEYYLLDKSIEDHIRDKTYPMRFYTCTK